VPWTAGCICFEAGAGQLSRWSNLIAVNGIAFAPVEEADNRLWIKQEVKIVD